MGDIAAPEKVLLLCSIFTRYEEAFVWAKNQLSLHYGRVNLESPPFDFSETGYYAPQMGEGLILRMVTFDTLIDPGTLSRIKVYTNYLEKEYAALARHPEKLPLNIDPGYLTLAKFILATTKDASHRIYLGEGIFAEVTLYFSRGVWHDLHWTYPNYRRADYKEFLSACRKLLSRRGK